ncbi:MAG TPA: autorepressor SdpR family transcription factor [Rhodothermales bacterium]|nr:autorepressor SdpR family transcription factor [Rhodothermales bacterium]
MKDLFKALNDPTRRAILDLLKDKELAAGEIAEAFDISWPSISHHLEILKRAELVTATRDGRFIHYALNTTVLEDAVQWMLALINTDTEEAP